MEWVLTNMIEHIKLILTIPYFYGPLLLGIAILIGLKWMNKMDRQFQSVHKSVMGVFEAEHMMGEDGQIYRIPPNYVSKSRLVEGDQLRVEILDDGTTYFKQIHPIERIKFIGEVVPSAGTLAIKDKNGNLYKTNQASIRFFDIREGDEVTAITSKNSQYCAIDQRIGAKGVLDRVEEELDIIE